MSILGTVIGALLGVLLLALFAMLVIPDDTETPASHAVAHAEGWPCSCPGRRQ